MFNIASALGPHPMRDLFRRPRADGIKRGDLFVKVEDPDTVWTVDRFVYLSGLPRHAELVSGGTGRNSRIMLSEVALTDRRLFRRWQPPPTQA